MTTTTTKPAKTARTAKAATAPKVETATKPAASTKVATPAVEKYGFRSDWTGPSDVTNAHHSRTKIDASVAGRYPQGNVTERDQKAMVALRAQFKGAEFERRNCDAGILRRLMERGLAVAVNANDTNARESKFKLTPAGMGKVAA